MCNVVTMVCDLGRRLRVSLAFPPETLSFLHPQVIGNCEVFRHSPGLNSWTAGVDPRRPRGAMHLLKVVVSFEWNASRWHVGEEEVDHHEWRRTCVEVTYAEVNFPSSMSPFILRRHRFVTSSSTVQTYMSIDRGLWSVQTVSNTRAAASIQPLRCSALPTKTRDHHCSNSTSPVSLAGAISRAYRMHTSSFVT